MLFTQNRGSLISSFTHKEWKAPSFLCGATNQPGVGDLFIYGFSCYWKQVVPFLGGQLLSHAQLQALIYSFPEDGCPFFFSRLFLVRDLCHSFPPVFFQLLFRVVTLKRLSADSWRIYVITTSYWLMYSVYICNGSWKVGIIDEIALLYVVSPCALLTSDVPGARFGALIDSKPKGRGRKTCTGRRLVQV